MNSGVSKFKKVSHVIFDLDGVLLDTEIVYKNAIATIAKRFGKTYTPHTQGKVIGTVERESSRIAITEMKLPMSVDQFQLEFRKLAHERFCSFPPPVMPGAEKLVKHLYKHQVPMGVATSSTQDSFDLKTERYKEFFQLFNHIVCGGTDPEVKEGKPKPDIFLVCASRFPDKPKPEQCLVVEDAPNGVKAALSAKMQVVMIPDENVPEELQRDAHFKISMMDQFPLEKFGLPSFRS